MPDAWALTWIPDYTEDCYLVRRQCAPPYQNWICGDYQAVRAPNIAGTHIAYFRQKAGDSCWYQTNPISIAEQWNLMGYWEPPGSEVPQCYQLPSWATAPSEYRNPYVCLQLSTNGNSLGILAYDCGDVLSCPAVFHAANISIAGHCPDHIPVISCDIPTPTPGTPQHATNCGYGTIIVTPA